MSEEILDEQTTTDEIEEQDNSTDEPIEEIDNSETDEPENEETAESEDEEHVEEEKADNETAKELIKKSFGDDETEKVQKFLKKMVGDTDISELSERELKILKSNYYAEKLANEKSQKLNELEKTKEQEAVKAEEQEIVQLDTESQQNYNYEVNQKNVVKESLLSDIKTAFEEGTPYRYLDGQTYIVDSGMLIEMSKDIERRYLADINGINNKYSQIKQTVDGRKAEKRQKDSERFFTEYETTIKDKLTNNPELAEVFNFIKKEAIPDKVFVDSAFSIVENAINKAAERIATQRQEKAENIKATSKAGGAVNNSSSSVSKPKTGNLTVDDILAMSDDEVAKL